jgi:hypothetical protein
MKDYPQKLFPFEIDGKQVRIPLKVCVFCGEPLERMGEFRKFEDLNHEMWACEVNEDLPASDPGHLVTFQDQNMDVVGFARDVDGDYWMFLPYDNYEITEHWLKPTTVEDLLSRVNRSIKSYKKHMDECEVVRRILG